MKWAYSMKNALNMTFPYISNRANQSEAVYRSNQSEAVYKTKQDTKKATFYRQTLVKKATLYRQTLVE